MLNSKRLAQTKRTGVSSGAGRGDAALAESGVSSGIAELKMFEKRWSSGCSGRAVKYVAPDIGRGLRACSALVRGGRYEADADGGGLAVAGLLFTGVVVPFVHGRLTEIAEPGVCIGVPLVDIDEFERMRLSYGNASTSAAPAYPLLLLLCALEPGTGETSLPIDIARFELSNVAGRLNSVEGRSSCVVVGERKLADSAKTAPLQMPNCSKLFLTRS